MVVKIEEELENAVNEEQDTTEIGKNFQKYKNKSYRQSGMEEYVLEF